MNMAAGGLKSYFTVHTLGLVYVNFCTRRKICIDLEKKSKRAAGSMHSFQREVSHYWGLSLKALFVGTCGQG